MKKSMGKKCPVTEKMVGHTATGRERETDRRHCARVSGAAALPRGLREKMGKLIKPGDGGGGGE